MLLSEQPQLVDKPPMRVQMTESDSDSGMGSPKDEGTVQPAIISEEPNDEDIVVNRKPRCRKVLKHSDCEEEDGAGMAQALVLSESSEGEGGSVGEENQNGPLKEKSACASLDSDESETEKGRKQRKEVKRKQRSQRHREKEEKRAKFVERAKRRERSELAPMNPPFNDSGCLLGDNELFDTGLEEGKGLEDDELSLEAIRAAVKQKAKNHKPIQEDDDDDEEEEGKKPQRKERKAALASKEALKQLHSESQRLVRESSLGLPYHMPEPKSIDQFFKRRPRPEGPVMALLKSAKYQTCILEATSCPQPNQQQPQLDQQSSAHDLTQCLDKPSEAGLALAAMPQIPINQVLTPSSMINDTPDANLQPAPLNLMAEHVGTELTELDQTCIGPNRLASEVPAQPSPDAEGLQPLSKDPGSLPARSKSRMDRLARLKEMGLDPPPVPRLCPDDGTFVHLEPPQVNSDLEALKERFLRHVQQVHPMAHPRGEHSVQVSIVRKDTSAPCGREELREDSITVTVSRKEEEEVVHTKPGEKLVLLKSRLQQAMALRRQEERERRAALHRLDNEQCDDEEEEEEEMTDESETEEGVDELLGGRGGEDEEDDGDDETDGSVRQSRRSPSPATLRGRSPPPDILNREGTLMLFAGSSCSRTGSLSQTMRRSEPAGQEGDTKLEEEDSLPLAKDNSHNSSFELIGSMIPSYQPINRAAGRGMSTCMFRSPSPGFYRPMFLGSASKSSGKLSDPSLSLSLPVEDSQDLYAPPSPGESGPLGASSDSQGRFSLEEDAHSQLLDADGFLNVGSRAGSHKRQLLLLDSLDENAMDANMGELLGLCSGGFSIERRVGERAPAEDTQGSAVGELLGLCSGGFGTQGGCTPSGGKERTGGQETAAQRGQGEASFDGDMEQLLALCSGKFTSPGGSPLPADPSPVQHLTSNSPDRKERGAEEDCEFRLLSDVESLSDLEGSEAEQEGEGGECVLEVEEDEEKEVVFGHRGRKRKMRLAAFVESEAELSGSDVGSEDEEEGGSEYEEEELLEDLPSDEELQGQVNKIHMKQVLDDDKRRLRLYQERYLADGDLHSDGPGRARRFRWKNIDNTFEMGVEGDEADEDEEEEDLSQAELQRRKERLEREQWVQEQQSKSAGRMAGREDEDDEDEKIGEEDSQFMKLAKKLTAKKLQQREVPVAPLQAKRVPGHSPFLRPSQPNMVKRGSLLSQPRAVLQKLASISEGNPSAPRNSRGFLFQTLSPEKGVAGERPNKQVRKRAQVESSCPVAKRSCREAPRSATEPQKSIFSYLES